MHFYEAMEKTIPKTPEVTPTATNTVTAQDLQDLKNAFSEQMENTMKTNNEAFKKEMLDFLKKENITLAGDISIKNEESEDNKNGS